MSSRTQAAIAVGVLAFSALGAPAAAIAQAPDKTLDGTIEVVESGDEGSVDLYEGAVSLEESGPAPVEEESAPEVAHEGSEVVEETAAEMAEDVVPEPDLEPVEDPAPASEPIAIAAPPAEVPAATDAPAQGDESGPKADSDERTKREPRAERVTRPVQQPEVASPVVVVDEAPAPVTVRVVAGATESAGVASAGGRFHVVQRGESLWSIAADLLGDGANVPAIAREVDRLWTLNEDRIGTGRPDLLYAGTRLRLR